MGEGGAGRLSGQRFPWGNTISEEQANYHSESGYPYDLSNPGYNPTFDDGFWPFTSPAGYFAPNGYGLYDMAGNVWNWCWDLFGDYTSDPQIDPRGPMSGQYGSIRVIRGGSYVDRAFYCRTAARYDFTPDYSDYFLGFRAVLPAAQ